MTTLTKWMCFVAYASALTEAGCSPWRIQDYSVDQIVISGLRRSVTVILFDANNDKNVLKIESWAKGHHFILKTNVEYAESFIYQHLEHVLETSSSIEDIRNNLQFIVLCNECLSWVLGKVSALDTSRGMQTLRHFSTWLFLMPHQASIPANLDTQIDNVAVLTMKCLENRTSDAMMSEVLPDKVLTLMWTPEGRNWTTPVLPDETEDGMYMHNGLFPNIKRGLNGREIVIATLQWYPWTIRQGTGSTSTFVGTSANIVNVLKQKHNFTFRFVTPEDDSWGARMENGTWIGIVGMITRQEVDMTGPPYRFSKDRTHAMDMSSPVDTPITMAMYATPRQPRYWTFLFSCFKWEVYVACAITVLCASVVYTGIVSIHGRCTLSGNDKHLHRLMLIGVKIPLRQDTTSNQAKTMSAKIFIFSWCLQCFLVTSIYSGGLVAFATVEKPDVPFKTLRDLSEQSFYSVAVIEGSVILNVFQSSTNPIFKKLYRKMEQNIIPMTDNYLQHAFDLIINRHTVLLTDGDTLETLRANSCEIHVMKEEVMSTYSGFGFTRRSPLKKLFDKTYSNLVETNNIAEMKRRWLPKPKKCFVVNHRGNNFKLSYLQTIFAVCAAGCFLGFLALLYETKRGCRRK